MNKNDLAAGLAACEDWKSIRQKEIRSNVCVPCLVRARRLSGKGQDRLFISGLSGRYSGLGHFFFKGRMTALCGRRLRWNPNEAGRP